MRQRTAPAAKSPPAKPKAAPPAAKPAAKAKASAARTAAAKPARVSRGRVAAAGYEPDMGEKGEFRTTHALPESGFDTDGAIDDGQQPTQARVAPTATPGLDLKHPTKPEEVAIPQRAPEGARQAAAELGRLATALDGVDRGLARRVRYAAGLVAAGASVTAAEGFSTADLPASGDDGEAETDGGGGGPEEDFQDGQDGVQELWHQYPASEEMVRAAARGAAFAVDWVAAGRSAGKDAGRKGFSLVAALSARAAGQRVADAFGHAVRVLACRPCRVAADGKTLEYAAGAEPAKAVVDEGFEDPVAVSTVDGLPGTGAGPGDDLRNPKPGGYTYDPVAAKAPAKAPAKGEPRRAAKAPAKPAPKAAKPAAKAPARPEAGLQWPGIVAALKAAAADVRIGGRRYTFRHVPWSDDVHEIQGEARHANGHATPIGALTFTRLTDDPKTRTARVEVVDTITAGSRVVRVAAGGAGEAVRRLVADAVGALKRQAA